MRKYLFGLIILLAAILRFWNLDSIPVSLSHDEVAIGYNAWSILKTGKDEYGESFPMLFRSFEDYKLPGYIYSTSFSEALFGLTPFAVRFSSALLGSLTVVVFYFLLKELFLHQRYFKKEMSEQTFKSEYKIGKLVIDIPLIASLFLAISPWHINFSRAAFESNASVFFIVLGSFFLFKSLTHPRFLFLSSVSYIFSFYYYYTARIIVPILVLAFVVIYRKEIFQFKKWLIISGIVGFMLLLPILPSMFTSGLSRVNQVSIFQDRTYTNPYSEARARNNNSLISKVFYNRRLAYFHHFSENYLKNFAPDFYFINGTGPMGLLYLWEFPFFFFGLYLLFKSRFRWKWFIFVWFLAVPLVGGFSTGQPNALRTLANAPIAAFMSSLGLLGILRMWKRSYIVAGVVGVVIMFFFIQFLVLYFDYHQPLIASHWQDGHQQMVEYVSENKGKYDTIVVSGWFWRPYIYMLFYSQYPPDTYQKYGSSKSIDTIKFAKADWDRGEDMELFDADLDSLANKKTLFILSSEDYKNQLNLTQVEDKGYKLKKIKAIDGTFVKPAFYAVELE